LNTKFEIEKQYILYDEDELHNMYWTTPLQSGRQNTYSSLSVQAFNHHFGLQGKEL